ncbi:sensor histidine kinase [Bacillus solitudinis]|uniref:sensor histidine kinase n=1 Tax=Bacillus solitudinis TaxID=2014074 RepID=UPI000C23E64B|nr:HAMP domain-containing sensor histidine kinase [Bacillus solitudinis]
MDKRQIIEQAAPKGRSTMSVNSILPVNKENIQSILSNENSSTTDELTYYIEELGIPFLKVDSQMNVVNWSLSVFDLLDVSEEVFSSNSTLGELEQHSSQFTVIRNSMEVAFQTNSVQEGLIEEEDSLIRIRTLPTLNGNAAYVMLEDRSLQKQFENLLTFHHQMEAVSHIAAGVAHELRNPLSVIKGFLQLAKLTNDFQKYYDTILSELNRMNGIIEDFLSVSRKKIDRKPQSPSEIMESLMEIMKSECLLHNVEFTVDVKQTSAFVHVNESMIKQVMLNLLRNSVEAFGKLNTNRCFWIETEVDETEYYIHVHDNGKGIPEEVLNQLGKPFFTTKEKGTGIGIPLCKKIIENHGGTFQIKSKYNVGTTVSLSLPLFK